MREFYGKRQTSAWDDRQHPGPILSLLKAMAKKAPVSTSRLILQLSEKYGTIDERFEKRESRVNRVVKAAVEKSCEVTLIRDQRPETRDQPDVT